MVRVRFAPSPTGQVHIGNIRTAIFNWLFARHEGGRFLLRIEDTDRERSTPEAVRAVLDSMAWLGIDYDEEPMYQSSRLQAHLDAANELLAGGHAYKEDKGGTGMGECVVFRMPGVDMGFHDVIKGDLAKAARDLKDFVIVRSDGTPVFHLANVVDDIEMGITHVIRGDDHIENTYRHVALYQALGREIPSYAHLPMIVNERGKPYSKRDGSAYVGEFRAGGFCADALFNYLALLGWSPGDDREKMTREEMMEAFSLSRIKSGPAQMDLKKLTHLNAEYVAEMPEADFDKAVAAEIADLDWAGAIDETGFREVCRLMQTRTHLFSYARGWKYFFSDEYDYDEKAAAKHLKKDGIRDALLDVAGGLEQGGFSADTVENALRKIENEKGIKQGKLNQAVRVAITGRAEGAGLYETAAMLGRERVVRRLRRAAERFRG